MPSDISPSDKLWKSVLDICESHESLHPEVLVDPEAVHQDLLYVYGAVDLDDIPDRAIDSTLARHSSPKPAPQEPFGFTVEREEKYRFRYTPRQEYTDRWTVYLPHQCDEWAISGDDAYSGHVPHEVAVARLEAFIAQAQDALTALKDRREVQP